VPTGELGQTTSVIEILVGQLFLVTSVAKVIRVWRPARWRAVGAGDDDAAPPREGGDGL
jgi:hypothetical protein